MSMSRGLLFGVVGSMVATAILEVDLSAIRGGESLRWSLIGLLVGCAAGFILREQPPGRARVGDVLLLGGCGGFVLGASLVDPAPGTPLALQIGHVVVGCLVVSLAVYIALRYDQRGRHRRGPRHRWT